MPSGTFHLPVLFDLGATFTFGVVCDSRATVISSAA